MKFIQESLSKIHSIRFLVAILLGVVLCFTNAGQAIAKSYTGAPIDNTVQSSKILEKAQDVLNAPPMTLEETEERSTDGSLNEIQGTAGKNEMNKSSDSTPAVVDQIEKVLDKTSKKK